MGTGFLLIPEQRSARQAIRRVVRGLAQSGRVRSPMAVLFLFGPSGVGKSALVQRLTQSILTLESAVRTVQRISAHDLDELYSPEASLTVRDLATVDLLILEDLQQLPNAARDDLERILNLRHARQLPTVVSADRGPAELSKFPRRLSSRLAAGLVVELPTIGATSLGVVVRRLLKDRSIKLSTEATQWLVATQSRGSLRGAMGVVNQLAHLPKPPTPMSRTQLESLLSLPTAENAQRTVPRIIARVAAVFGVPAKELLGRSRLRTVLVPRHVAMYLVREVLKLSLPAIGRAFERDHKTVSHALDQIQHQLQTDAELAGKLRALRGELE